MTTHHGIHTVKYETREVWAKGYQGQEYKRNARFLVCSCGWEERASSESGLEDKVNALAHMTGLALRG